MEIAPNGLIGRKNLAYALKYANHPREAIAVLRPAVEHNVDDADVWQLLGECFVAEQDWKNAKAVLEGALRRSGADKKAIDSLLATVREHLDQGVGTP